MSQRRTFLKAALGAGAAAAVSPFVPLLEAESQAGKPPKRLVVITGVNGMPRGDRHEPIGGETDFTLNEVMEPLAPFRDKLTIVRGVSNPYFLEGQREELGRPHPQAAGQVLTARRLAPHKKNPELASGPSIDHVIAQQIAALPDAPAAASVQLDAGTDVSYAGAEARLAAVSPRDAAQRLFVADDALDPRLRARLIARRGASFSLLRDQLSRVESLVGRADQDRIASHLEALNSLDGELSRQGGSCAAPSLDGGSGFDDHLRDQMKITAAALRCDATRVATIGVGGGQRVHSWFGVDMRWHDLSHWAYNRSTARARERQPVAAEAHFKIERGLAGIYASLLAELDSAIEPDGSTVLDNTMVVYINNMRTGSHQMDNLPVWIAGRAGGDLAGGRFVTVDGSLAQLHNSIAHLMGFPMNDFGDTSRGGRGPFDSLLRDLS